MVALNDKRRGGGGWVWPLHGDDSAQPNGPAGVDQQGQGYACTWGSYGLPHTSKMVNRTSELTVAQASRLINKRAMISSPPQSIIGPGPPS